ncbi:S26 family signal peptidase [Acidithiobacillus sp. MC6.1]|nr:S26 family signal peptidase [Acidithiobacillus sp. MC6.1]
MKLTRLLLRGTFWLSLAVVPPVAGVIIASQAFGWSLNLTTCMPVGLYQRGPVPRHLEDGDQVFFCPDQNNPAMRQAIKNRWLEYAPRGKWHCPDRLMPFEKFVAATAGQSVEITPNGVIANGHLLQNSKVLQSIDGGRIHMVHLPYGRYKVPPGMFWDYAPGNFAFTSSYYGPVPVRSILGSIRPVPFLTIPGSQFWQKHG